MIEIHVKVRLKEGTTRQGASDVADTLRNNVLTHYGDYPFFATATATVIEVDQKDQGREGR